MDSGLPANGNIAEIINADCTAVFGTWQRSKGNPVARILKVVVADDEPIMQMYLEETVTMLGHEVVAVANNGSELVELARKYRPDLIVTDIRMPGCDGYEAVRQICRDCALPVVFVSGFDEAGRVELAEAFCVANYLTKPVNEEQLSAGIGTVLDRFERYKLLLKEAPGQQEALDRLRRVQQALKLLFRRDGLKESEAFKKLDGFAENQRIPLSEAAERVMAGQAVG